MKKMKLTAMLLTVATMVFSVAGCGAKFDAKTYVEGSLDAVFKHEISDEYAKMTQGGKEAIEADYEAAIEEITNSLAEVGISEEMTEDFKVAVQDVFKVCKYNVGEAVKDDKGNYTVSVEVEPLVLGGENLMEEAQNYAIGLVTEQPELAQDEAAFMEMIIQFMLEKIQESASNPVYREAQTVEVRVEKVDKNLYDVRESDLEKLMNTILVAEY